MPTGVYPRVPRECSLTDCSLKHFALGYCSKHYSRARSKGDPRAVSIFDEDTSPAGFRCCRYCYTVKPLEDFRVQIKGRSHRARSCKKCDEKVNKVWRESHKEKVASAQRRQKVLKAYGPEGILVLARSDAGEPCDICGGRSTRMAIDHEHYSGVVRGLLCSNCNTALGLVKENKTTLLAMLSYLEKFKGLENYNVA